MYVLGRGVGIVNGVGLVYQHHPTTGLLGISVSWYLSLARVSRLCLSFKLNNLINYL